MMGNSHRQRRRDVEHETEATQRECGVVLSRQEYEQVKNAIRTGSLEKLKRIFSGGLVIGRRSMEEVESFDDAHGTLFMIAVRHGKARVVDFFLENYPRSIDVNRLSLVATSSPPLKQGVHRISYLHAAAIAESSGIARTLVEVCSADVNIRDCCETSPLHSAAKVGCLEVMELLIEKGAEIDAKDRFGNTALFYAVDENRMEAVKLLIARGADTTLTNQAGLTLMHVAASRVSLSYKQSKTFRSRDPEIARYLLSIGVSPCFREANPEDPSYVPCPLFLASSDHRDGGGEVAEMLLSHPMPQCPPACRADALILLHVECLPSQRPNLEQWREGLEIRQQCKISPNFPSFKDNAYENKREIQTLADLQAVPSEYPASFEEGYYQSLLLWERCLGYADPVLMCSLRKFAFLTLSASPKASERLYVRFLEMQNYKWERQHSSSSGIFYQEFEHKIVDAVEDSLHIAIGLFEDQQSPRLDIYIQYFMKALGVLLATRKHSCESHMTGKRWECIKAVVKCILTLFCIYLACNDRFEDKAKGYPLSQVEDLGHQFVSKHLFLKLPHKSSILHYVVTLHTWWLEHSERTNLLFLARYMDPLVSKLFSWGAVPAVEFKDRFGQKPVLMFEHDSELSTNRFAERNIYSSSPLSPGLLM